MVPVRVHTLFPSWLLPLKTLSSEPAHFLPATHACEQGEKRPKLSCHKVLAVFAEMFHTINFIAEYISMVIPIVCACVLCVYTYDVVWRVAAER